MEERIQDPGQTVHRSLAELQVLRDAAESGPWITKPSRLMGAPKIHGKSGKLIFTIFRQPEAAQATADFIVAIHDAVAMLEAVAEKLKYCPNCDGFRYEQIGDVEIEGGPPCPYCLPILRIWGGSHDE